MTVAVLLALVAACLALCRRAISRGCREDRLGAALYRPPETKVRGLRVAARPPSPADAPTAVLMVRGFDAVGLEALSALHAGFGDAFARVVFVALRPFDGPGREDERRRLLETLEGSLRRYAPVAALLDLAAEVRVAAGPDPLESMLRLAREISTEFPRAVFLCPRVEAPEEDRTAREIRDLLRKRGFATAELWIPVRE